MTARLPDEQTVGEHADLTSGSEPPPIPPERPIRAEHGECLLDLRPYSWVWWPSLKTRASILIPLEEPEPEHEKGPVPELIDEEAFPQHTSKLRDRRRRIPEHLKQAPGIADSKRSVGERKPSRIGHTEPDQLARMKINVS